MSFTDRVAEAQSAVDQTTAESHIKEIDAASANLLAAVARFIKASRQSSAFLNQFDGPLPGKVQDLEDAEAQMVRVALEATDQLEAEHSVADYRQETQDL